MTAKHEPTDGFSLPRQDPETQGVASAGILAFLEAADRELGGLNGFMLLRHGRVVAEGTWAPNVPDEPHMLFSLSKSFTSTAVGLAIEDGLLSLDVPVPALFAKQAPDRITANLGAMQVRHLLSMSTGHATDTTAAMCNSDDGDWISAFLHMPVEYEPGTHFLYNSGASYMLSAIVGKVTGLDTHEFLRRRLFEPLGIRGTTWETCPQGRSIGGWGLSLRTADIARFGQLYLQRGVWCGKRILPESWVAEATSRQVANGDDPNSDWAQGYGYQFWRCRHDVYRGDGAFGQFCVVMPNRDAVLAITSGVGNMQAVLDLAWTHLLPAMHDSPLPADGLALKRLREKLDSLEKPTLDGTAASPVAETLSGKTFELEPNEPGLSALSFAADGPDTCTVTYRHDGETHSVACGFRHWVKGTAEGLGGMQPRPAAACYAWAEPDVLQLKIAFLTTPFCLNLTLRFTDDTVVLQQRMNVSFGPVESPEIRGRLTPGPGPGGKG